VSPYAEVDGAVYAEAVGGEGCRLPPWNRGPSTPPYRVPEGRTLPCAGLVPVEGGGDT